MDISDTLAPKSEQLDAIDLQHSGPRVFTVERVSEGSADQPVQVHLAEFPRAWRPSKNMRRVLAHCWGPQASEWTGRRVRLWCDPKVTWGGQEVGGVRISHLSHIDQQKTVQVMISQGRYASYKVDPLVEDPSVALNAAKKRVQAAAPEGVDLRTWVPEQLKDEPGGVTTENLNKLAESLEAGQ